MPCMYKMDFFCLFGEKKNTVDNNAFSKKNTLPSRVLHGKTFWKTF